MTEDDVLVGASKCTSRRCRIQCLGAQELTYETLGAHPRGEADDEHRRDQTAREQCGGSNQHEELGDG
jgi:hypothetical protein